MSYRTTNADSFVSGCDEFDNHVVAVYEFQSRIILSGSGMRIRKDKPENKEFTVMRMVTTL